jgi:hypothetical protein
MNGFPSFAEREDSDTMKSFGFLSICAGLLAAVLAAPLHAAVDPLFASDEVLSVNLTGPFRKISRDRAETPELRAGQLGFTDETGAPVTLTVQLEPRGKSRRDREVCVFPPLWVHFDKSELKDTLFSKQNKLKMVTHCRSQESFQDYVLKEYLAYRIFNRLSDMSFRVRLLKVSYQDSEGKGKPLERYGFFIEHKKRLAKRLDRKVLEPAEQIASAALDGPQATIAELFQFMVSNTDFSFIAPPEDDTCCHNAVLFDGGEGRFLPVPYDFDRTGLVDPPNGLPDANLGQRTFRNRVFRGFCRDEPMLEEALAKTRAERTAIEALIREQPDLRDRSRRQALDFVGSYYALIDDEKKRAKALKCRTVRTL